MWLKSRKLLSVISAVIFLGVIFSAVSQRIPVAKLYGDLTENTGSTYTRFNAEDLIFDCLIKRNPKNVGNIIGNVSNK